MFSTHGVADNIISDNATAFVGQECQDLLQYVTSAAYHSVPVALLNEPVAFVKKE